MITRKIPGCERLEQRKKGFTLTEIAIVLGIMGLILGAIWVAAASVYNNQRVNQANAGIMQVLQGIRTLYAQQATIEGGDRTADLIGAGVIPTNFINGTTMRSPWGGNMYVGGTGDDAGIVIALDKMTTAVCVGLVSTIFGASHDRTLTSSSTVADGDITAFPTVATLGTPVTSPAPPVTGGSPTGGTGTGCTASSATNNAVFVFGLQG